MSARISASKRLIFLVTLFAVLALSACTTTVQAPPPAAATAAPAAEQTTGDQAAGVDWRQFEGSKLNLLLISHPFVDALQPLLPEFTEKTGIEVTTEVLAEQPGFEKLVSDLSSGTGTYDLFMTSPLNNWQYATAGWVEPLDAYLGDPAKTAADYDLADFFPEILNSNRWTLTPMSGIGEGNLWALPINYETYLLAYRPSILKAQGIAVPTTYEELLAAGPQLTFKGDDGQQTYGVITRFDKYWDLPFLTFGTMLQSYGVQMLDADGKLQICSSESIKATEDFIKLIKSSSPEGAGAFTWYDALQGFSSGQYAMAVDEADLFAPTYEDPKQSKVSDDVGYALAPLGPTGERKAGAWIWSMSINSASKNKDASWLFLQWLTSKETMIKTHLAGNMNPVRQSAWDDPEVAALVDQWGETPGQYKAVVQEMGKVAGIRFPPHPELTRMLDTWAGAVQKSYFEGGNVEANLCAAQKDIQAILDE